jgi:hypothetical protein
MRLGTTGYILDLEQVAIEERGGLVGYSRPEF